MMRDATMEMTGKNGILLWHCQKKLNFDMMNSRRSHYRLIVENIASGTNWQVRIAFLSSLLLSI
jgi:hypothetical protein